MFEGGGGGEGNKTCTSVGDFCGIVETGDADGKTAPGTQQKILSHHFPRTSYVKRWPQEDRLQRQSQSSGVTLNLSTASNFTSSCFKVSFVHSEIFKTFP